MAHTIPLLGHGVWISHKHKLQSDIEKNIRINNNQKLDIENIIV